MLQKSMSVSPSHSRKQTTVFSLEALRKCLRLPIGSVKVEVEVAAASGPVTISDGRPRPDWWAPCLNATHARGAGTHWSVPRTASNSSTWIVGCWGRQYLWGSAVQPTWCSSLTTTIGGQNSGNTNSNVLIYPGQMSMSIAGFPGSTLPTESAPVIKAQQFIKITPQQFLSPCHRVRWIIFKNWTHWPLFGCIACIVLYPYIRVTLLTGALPLWDTQKEVSNLERRKRGSWLPS